MSVIIRSYEDRAPMNELEHTVDIVIDMELARMAVQDMHMTHDDNGICFTGRFYSPGGAAGARVDIFVKGSVAMARFCPLYRDQFDAWIKTQLSQPMITQVPTRAC